MSFRYLICLVLVFVPFSSIIAAESVAEEWAAKVRIFGKDKELQYEFAPFGEKNIWGNSLSTADVDGDRVDEIIVGAGKGQKPMVRIFTSTGVLVREWLAYGEDFTGGVNLWGGDLDGDGKGEILTGAGVGGGPHVRVFDGFGKEKINTGFSAFGDKYNKGIKVAAGNLFGDATPEIWVWGQENKKNVLKFFDLSGQDLKKDIILKDFNYDYFPSVAPIDLGGDGIKEILVGSPYNSLPVVRLYRGDGSLVAEYTVYTTNFRGGVNAVAIDWNNDHKQEILIGAGVGGGSHVKVITGFNIILAQWNVYADTFTGGAQVAVLNHKNDFKIVTLPVRLPSVSAPQEKKIDIDISEQRMRYYDGGVLISDHVISTGRPSLPTRQGEFRVLSKFKMAYGGIPGEKWDMPYWIGFYFAGSVENGMHGLPLINGMKESARSLGRALSHGCVRSSDEDQRKLYEWVRLGDKVVVHE